MDRRFVIIAAVFGILALPHDATGQQWSTSFGAPPTGQGLDDEAWTLTVYQNKLIVGGLFAQAGPIAAAGVAAWDGTQWTALGAGIPNSTVTDLAVYDGELIAVGQTGSSAFIKRWNGSTWSSIACEISAYCRCGSQKPASEVLRSATDRPARPCK